MTDIAEAQALWTATTDRIWADERIVDSILSGTVVRLHCEATRGGTRYVRTYVVSVAWGAWRRTIERQEDIENACVFLRGGR